MGEETIVSSRPSRFRDPAEGIENRAEGAPLDREKVRGGDAELFARAGCAEAEGARPPGFEPDS